MRNAYLYLLERGPKLGMILMLIAFVLGGAFRFYGLNWSDQGSHHPDENQIMMQVGKLSYRDMNPHFFAYGSLPLYMYKFMADGVFKLHRAVPFTVKYIPNQPYMLARSLSAFLSWLTIWLVYAAGKRLYGKYVGILAGVFYAFSAMPIKNSHFLTVDGIQTFFIMCTLYFGARIVQKGRLRDYIPAGIFYGMALASKFSAVTTICALVTAHVVRLVRARRPFGFRLWFGFVMMLLFIAIAFFVCMPYAVLDWREFYTQVKYQGEMVAGKTIPWYVLHYEDTKPVIYQLYNYLWWGVGIPLGILTMAGFVFMIIAALRRWKGEHLYLLAMGVPYFLMVYVMAFVKFLRYQLPVMPVFCIMGAYLLYWLYCHYRSAQARNAVLALTFFVILSSLLFSIAVMSIYYRANTWEAASRWMYENVSPNSTILKQEIEASLPIGLPGYRAPLDYKYQEVNVIEEPHGRYAVQQFAEKVAASDYIVLPNPGQYNLALSAGPKKFPIIVSYFQNLFGGKLGFDLVATFDSPPTLFGHKFDDSMADIEVWFFDHPKVQIFKKIKSLTSEQITDALTKPSEDVTLISKKQIRTAQSGAKLSPSLFAREFGAETSSSEPAKGFPYIFIWYLIVQLLAFLVLPLAIYVFHELPDHGYAVAKIMGLFVVAWINWFLVNIKVINYNRESVLVAIALVIFTSLYYLWRNPERFYRIWQLPGFKSQVLLTEMVFLGCYLIFMGIKVMNPDIYNWERPSEFSYFNALNRGDTLPPYDPWISGHPLNYYYYGWHVMVMLTKLLGIPTHFSYNMGVGLIAGLVGMGVFSLVYNITRRRFYGLLGVLIFNFVGNYDGLRQVFNVRHFFPFNWFQSAHSPIEYTISEFPFWSYLYGDLHPHVIVLPVILLLFTFMYRILTTHDLGYRRFGNGMDGVLCFFLLAMTCGTISTIHLWDMPAQAAITFFVFLFAYQRITSAERGRLGESFRPKPLIGRLGGLVKHVFVPTVLIWLAGDLLFLPYPLGLDTATSRSGLLVMLLKPILPKPEYADATFTIAPAPTLSLHGGQIRSYTSPLWQSMMIFGLFLFVTLAVMLVRNWEYGRIRGKSLLWPFSLFAQVYVILAMDLWSRKELNYTIKDTPIHFQTFVRALFIGVGLFFLIAAFIALKRYLSQERELDRDARRFKLRTIVLAVGQVGVLGLLYYIINDRGVLFFNTLGNLGMKLSPNGKGVIASIISYFIGDPHQLARATSVDVDYGLALLLVPFVLGLWYSLRETEFHPGDQFATLLLFMASGIVLGDELIYLADFLSGGDWCRMNSVFKFHFQAVALFSIGITLSLCFFKTRLARLLGVATSGRRFLHLLSFVCGVLLLSYLFSWVPGIWVLLLFGVIALSLLGSAVMASRRSIKFAFFNLGINVFDFIFVVMIVLSLVFPLAGPFEKVKERSNSRANIPTLNGIAFKKEVNPEEYEALNWLNANIKGSPVILETTGPSYQEYSRVSMNTGLPTVLGWGSHVVARGFSWKEIIEDRGKGLDLIYDTKDVNEALKIIKKYNVGFIYVGYLERKRNDPEGLEKFDRFKNIFNLIFENKKVKIYEVRGHNFWGTGAQAAKEEPAANASDQEMELALSGNMMVGGKGSNSGQFKGPRGLALDAQGNLYVADAGNNRVQKFDASGNFLQLWQRQGAAEPFTPWSLAISADGKVLATDLGRNAVWSLPDGDQTPRAFIDVEAKLNEPRGLAIRGERVYIADTGNHRIVVTDLSGKVVSEFGGYGSSPGKFLRPTGVAVDQAGIIYVADAVAKRIQKFGADTKYQSQWQIDDEPGAAVEDIALATDQKDNILATAPGKGTLFIYNSEGMDMTRAVTAEAVAFSAPAGIAVRDPAIFVSDTTANRIQKIVKQEPPNIFKAAEGSRNGQFKVPRDIAVDAAGNIFVVDFHNFRIQKFNARGEFVTAWGAQGEEVEQFKDPCGIAVAPNGNVYVADTWNNRVQVFNNNGKFLKTWSGGVGGFFAPRGIAVDKQGTVYVIDTGNGRVQIFNADGNFIRAFSKRGNEDTDLYEPCGIAVDEHRNVYVADSGNHRVQVFSYDGAKVRSFDIPEWEGPVQEPYMEMDAEGTGIFITMPNANKVVYYSVDGTKRGEFNKRPGFDFNAPTGIALAPSGELLIMNMNEPKAFKISTNQFH